MKDLFVTSSMNYLIKNGYNSEEEIEKYTYGLEGLYSFVTKFGAMLILNIIFKTWLEFLVFQFTYSFIRAVAFGTHAKNNILCWISTSITFIGLPLFIKYIEITKLILLIVSIISSIIIIIFAPADTEARPLIDANKRKQNKILSSVVCLIFLLIMIVLNNNLINKCIFYALLLEAIMVNPLTYYVFGHPYNNYKYYKD